MNQGELVLGIDGGGTKTVCWLASVIDPNRVLGCGKAGPSNPRAVGIDAACAEIDTAIDAAFQDTRIVRGPVAASTIGLAGAGNVETQAAVATWAKGRHIAQHIRVVPDCDLVLAAGSPDGIGVGLISGTGSLAFGRNAKGKTARAGGWGYLLSDEGSGYAIGRAAVRAVIDLVEETESGCDDGELLKERLFDHFQVTNIQQIVSVIHAADDPRSALARLAPLVSQSAEEGDTLAIDTLGEAADDLAIMVETVAERLGWTDSLHGVSTFPLAIAGGILTGSQIVRDELLKSCSLVGVKPDMTIVPEPVAGAIALASQDISALYQGLALR